MWGSAISATLLPMTSEAKPDILCAVERHRHRLAAVLDRLDDARRAASEAGIVLVAGDGGDLGAALDHYCDDLRNSDRYLQSLVAELAHPS
jgi:hypothetical protein